MNSPLQYMAAIVIVILVALLAFTVISKSIYSSSFETAEKIKKVGRR